MLDVGCGPGTNAEHFAHADYLGIDVNPAYVATASRRHGRRFVTADVTGPAAWGADKFDFILVNSLLHHLDSPSVRRLLARLGSLVSDDGYIHILELVLPPERHSLRAVLANADRGRFARPLSDWRLLFEESLAIDGFEPYSLGFPGIPLWSMVYCRARAGSLTSRPSHTNLSGA